MIRIAIVDDHPVFRIGMAALLQSLDGIEVVGQADSAATGSELLTSAPTPDVILMDIDLDDGSGVYLTRDLLRTNPGVRILVVSMHGMRILWSRQCALAPGVSW